VPPAGFEPATHGLGNRRTPLLVPAPDLQRCASLVRCRRGQCTLSALRSEASYAAVAVDYWQLSPRPQHAAPGVEPRLPALETSVRSHGSHLIWKALSNGVTGRVSSAGFSSVTTHPTTNDRDGVPLWPFSGPIALLGGEYSSRHRRHDGQAARPHHVRSRVTRHGHHEHAAASR
jgi:hypothetical protein